MFQLWNQQTIYLGDRVLHVASGQRGRIAQIKNNMVGVAFSGGGVVWGPPNHFRFIMRCIK